ncbi:hypothetical protein NIES4071_103690 (plasmid) [Calothrix sp. NIES-4071]|nr:hypothetical protein NIES4071_103690 [Calothrix sp. NIES-4071]BAZ64356.1 hypothetical protein NIES4105_100890 [Calothrix sp. NIES-4105]
MISNGIDVLPLPHSVLAALRVDYFEGARILERTYMAATLFKCDSFNTGRAWDVGCCLGYCIYATPEDYPLLKLCEQGLSRFAQNLVSVYYDIQDRRPYGVVIVKQHAELLTLSTCDQIIFLSKCNAIDSSS